MVRRSRCLNCLSQPRGQVQVATQTRLRTRRMLLAESQRRQKADRKKKWADYRLAKEAASGKPMRRVRMKHR